MTGQRLWRCMNCTKPGRNGDFDFTGPREAAKVTCPQCGVSGGDPQTAPLLLPLVLVHYEPPHDVAGGVGVGAGHLACNPSHPAKGTAAQVTGVPQAVTCPACIAAAGIGGVRAAPLDLKYDPPIRVAKDGSHSFGKGVSGGTTD